MLEKCTIYPLLKGRLVLCEWGKMYSGFFKEFDYIQQIILNKSYYPFLLYQCFISELPCNICIMHLIKNPCLGPRTCASPHPDPLPPAPAPTRAEMGHPLTQTVTEYIFSTKIYPQLQEVTLFRFFGAGGGPEITQIVKSLSRKKTRIKPFLATSLLAYSDIWLITKCNWVG